jgi:antitoxin component of MazEF toxin-antitoxin module
MPHEETRKIIKVGNSYAVTIPKPWLRYFRLNEKDEVRLISNSTIVIEPPQKKTVDCASYE